MSEKFIYSDQEHIFALRTMNKFLAGHKGFVAGGCFKNLFSGERPKDVDVFFRSQNDWNAAAEALGKDSDFEPAYTSENVVGYRHIASNTNLELVRTIFGSPEEIISQFDFTVAKFAYYSETEEDESGVAQLVYKAVYHPKFFEHLHL